MADTRVTIDVDLNTSPAAQGLRDLQRQYNAFTSSLNKNNAAQAAASRQYSDQLLRMVNSSQMFTAETVKMQTAAGRLDKTLAKGQVTMGQFFSARFLRDSNAAAQVLSLANARAAALQTQFFATSAAANGMRDAIAVRPYEAFNSALTVSAQKLAIHRAMLMQATTHMINFGKNTQWAGRQLMVGFTVPLTIFGGVAGKVFRDLEEQAINFKKVYGDIFTTEEETQEALDAVKELSVEFTKYGIAVRDTMELAGVAAQSGLRNAELMAATTQATRLATLGQMEQAEAMKTIISLQTAFQTSNEGLAESVDFLNIIENQTVLALRDVAGAIPRVAPVIQGLGGDVKDLAVLLVAMKEGGVSAGEGANALKTSLSRLISPTKAATDMAAEFGINLNQIVESNRGEVVPMIKELADAMQSLDGLSQQRLLSEVFGKRQFARMGALFNSITNGSSQAARAMDLINMSAKDLAATAEKELGTVEESVGARFTAAMEKAKVAIAPLGEAFLNLSIPVINMFTKIIDKFNELPDFAKKFAVFGSVLVGVVIPVGTMFLGLLMNLVGTLIKFGFIVGIAFKGFTSGGIKGAIDAVSQALNYMSLEEIDAANAAKQLGDSTLFVNEALRQQVPRSAEATTGINQLGAAYATLIARMREAAAMSASQGGAFVVPGAAAAAASRGRARGYNKGGKIRTFNEGNTVPGVGNTDTVPAMLTPGEFVVNKQATKENIGLLTAINDGSNVQFRNRGGGIAEPGRMFYGRVPKVLSADDFMAMAAKGPSELEQIAAAQAREVGIGTSTVSNFAPRVLSRVAGSKGLQSLTWADDALNVARLPKNLVDEINDSFSAQLRSAGVTGFSPQDLMIIKDLPLGVASLSPKLNNSLRSSRGSVSSLIKEHTEDDVFRELFETSYMSDKLGGAYQAQIAKQKIDDAMLRQLEVERRRRSIFNLSEDTMSDDQYSLLAKRAFERSGYKDLWQKMDVETRGARRFTLKTPVARETKKAFGGKGYEIPITNALDDLVSKGSIAGYKTVSIPNRRRTGYFIEDNNGNIYKLEPSATRDIPGQVSYQSVAAREGKVKAHFMNKGGQVPGMQYLFGGGSVLSRAAQIRRIKEANVGSTMGLEDMAVSSLFKRFRFNDVRGADSPSAFVKGMFERWETTPTRISPKENTTMLLKGKKPKYDPVTQEDYLANMIISLDKFSDAADAFKPISVGTTPGGKARVFDGHTRLHAQTVKGLIARMTGKDTSTMSREEIVDGIRMVQNKSLAGEITDTDIMRSVAGQRVLTTKASRRETERLFERPGKQAPMASMLNRQGRVLLPEIHGKEIEAIVNAARKANFYGVGKDTESLMKAMGFVSLGGGARYRYEPKHDFRNRSSYVNNVGRRIIDDLIDAGEILPLRRNKGGMIPAIQQLGGGGRAVELLRSYMAGNFDVMRNPATRKQVLSLGETMSGTLYRGTQIGAGTLPKHVERALLQAEKTGDYSKLVGKKFKMRSSDWSRSESTAQRFTQMNSVKDRQNFLNYERNLTTRQIDDAQRYIEQAESGRLAFVNQQKLDQSRKSLPMLRQDLERINRELGEIGELAPVLIKAKGAMKGVDASRIAPDATYMGRTISESNVIASGGMFQIKSASRGNLEIVPVQRRNEGGEIFESGSRTIVPGVGNTDTVPAMLTPGEFVINKKATRENKSLLQSINNGNSLNQGGRVQFLNTGNPVSDWGDFADPAEQKPSKKERFERSAIGRYAGQRLAAGERSGVLLATAQAMRMNAPQTGIVVQELVDYENLTDKQKTKERHLRRAEAGAAKYERAMQVWNSNGRPAPPPEVRSNAEKTLSGQRASTATGQPAPKIVLGFDQNGNPITNRSQADGLLKQGKLFDYPEKGGKRIYQPLTAFDAPLKPASLLPNDDPETPKRFGMTRAQKIWAAISAITMAGVGTGIAVNERSENEQFPINMFNKGGKVPAMLTPGEFVVDKEKAENNLGLLYAINGGMKLNKGGQVPGYAAGGLAQAAIGMGLSIPGGLLGAQAGESMGGDTGAMIGGMAGSIIPFMLPYGKMGSILKGGLPKKGVELDQTKILTNKMEGTTSKVASAGDTTAKSMLATAGQFLRLGRLIPLLFNPYTALAAAVAGTVYTLYKMNESNKREYEAGRKLAEAMSTSAEDISQLGQTARDRAKNIDNYLDQSESAAIEQEYATKIAEAKTKEEKKRLELERDAIVKERGNQTRRESVEEFYKEEIEEAKKRNASQEELRRLYDQRNMSLGVQFQKEAEFEIDKTFGAEFIKGSGEKQFKQFEAMRGASAMVSTGQISQAQANTMTRLADATYGMSMSFEKMAERDMASKLAQYVVSGTLTQDQAASVAEAIGAEMGDLEIGKSIREELTGIVGVEGGRVRYSPGLVATQLAEENARRVEELRELTYSRAGAMFTTNPNAARDIASGIMLPGAAGFAAVGATQPSRTFDEEAFREGVPTGFNFFTQFFSGMADEFRRNIGSLIELQANEVQMLEENIAAVGLNYNDLIAKAKTLEEAERLRLERARAVGKLQERLDEARTKQLQMAFGTENQEAIKSMLEPYRQRTESMQAMNERRATVRQEFREIDPLTSGNFLPNIFERTIKGLELFGNNLVGGILSLNNKVQKELQKRFPSGMAPLMTKQTREALVASYEGTPMQASLGMFESIFDASAETPEFVRIYTEALNDPEFAEAVFTGFESGIRKVKAAVEAGQLDYGIEESVMGELSDVLKSFSLPVNTIQEYGMLLNQLNAEQIYNVTEAFKQLGQQKGLEVQEQAMERFLPLFTQLGQISAIDMPGLGGKNIVESILGDEKTFAMLGKNDELMQDMMNFISFVSELPSELQIGFLEDKTIDQMIKAGRELDKFDASRFRNSIKSIKSLLKDGFKLEGKEIDEGVKLIELSLNRLNEIEDPEIRASLKADISPLIYEMLRLMRELDSASVTEAQDIFDRILLLQDEVTEATNAAVQKEEETVKKSGGGGGGSRRESPLNQLLRDLRDQISAREKIGRDIYGANEKAKGIFTKLRKQDASQSVIEYLKSLSPEDAISVGQELLKNEKKLNSLMALQSQNAIAQQREATKTAKARKETMQFLNDSRLFGQQTFTFGAEALQDEQFISGFEKAMADPKNARKAARDFLENYTRTRKQERNSLIAQRRIMVGAEIQRNRQDQRLAIELVEQGLDQTEIETALKNDLIREDIAKRIEEGKKIPQEIVAQIKSLTASQKTPIDQINESVDDILNVYTEMSNILQSAIDKIETFNIKPLEEELQDIQRESAEYSEQQRRLSRTLSDLQEKENDLKEEQKEEEEKINESYDLRIKALEKINDVNKDIEDRQKGQLTVADALSRGDIAAAAKAAQEMQAKAAQARREEAIEAVRERKEEDIANFKEASEQKLKNLTIDVNGELLNREQIEERINNLDQQIYDNSLLQYDLQQKITAERDKQQKIAEAQQKVAAASNIVSRITELGDQSLAPEDRRMRLMGIQAELRAQDTPGAQQLLSFLESNSQQIISGNIREISEGLAGALNVFNEGFGQEFQKIISSDIYKDIIPPDISGIMQEALTAADASIQLALDDIDENVELFEQEVEKKDPFATLIGGVKKLSKLAKELLKDIPKPPGSGGGSGGDEPKDTTEAVEPEQSWKLGTPIKEPENMQKVTKRYTLKNGLVVTVTRYYDPITGNPVPDKNGRPLTIYETQRREEGPGGGIVTAQTDVSQAVSDMRNPVTGYEGSISRLPSSVLGSGGEYEERKLSLLESASEPYRLAKDAVNSLLEDPEYEERAKTLGSDVFSGIVKGITQGNIDADPDAVRQYLIDYLEDPAVFDVGSPAKSMYPVGKSVAEGIIEGVNQSFSEGSDTILGAKILSWFRNSIGFESGESGATSGIGNQIGSAVANAVSAAFKTITTASLPINVAGWLKRSLGIEGINISQNIKDVGESISFGIKNGMVEWFDGKIATDVWTALKTWVHNAFGIEGNGPSNKAKLGIGYLVSSGIKAGMIDWFNVSTKDGDVVWSALKSWIDKSFGAERDQTYSEARPIGTTIVNSIASGMKTVSDDAQESILASKDNLVKNVATSFEVWKDGQIAAQSGGKWYNIGKAIIDSITNGLRDDNARRALEAEKTSAAGNPEAVSSSNQVSAMYGGIIKRAFGGMINYKGSREPAPGMMMGGKVKKYAAGGFVPGIGMTDKVPALLTPGEFVVRKSVAQTMMPALKNMNSQVFPGMGIPQQRSFNVSSPQFESMRNISMDSVRFGVPQNINSYVYPQTNLAVTQTNMESSPVTNAVGPTTVQYNYNLNVSARTNASADEIANSVMYKIKRFDDRKIRGTQVG